MSEVGSGGGWEKKGEDRLDSKHRKYGLNRKDLKDMK